jgi:antitoxin PrlF
MARRAELKSDPATCCAGESCCQIVAIVSVDARGQMVLPKELRDQAGIAPGDKLALTALRRGETVVCLTLSKANDLAPKLEELLRPLFLGPRERHPDEEAGDDRS